MSANSAIVIRFMRPRFAPTLGPVPRSGQRLEQSARIRVQGILEQRDDISLFHDLAGIHDLHVLGELRHDPKVMGNQQNRHTHLFLERLQQFQDLRLNSHIQSSGGLVGNQQVRLAG